MEIVSRETAKLLGLSRYFTGKPCRKGHVAQRLTSDCRCIECHRKQDREKKRASRAEHPEKHRVAQHSWRVANPEKVKERNRANYAKNSEKHLAQKRAKYAEDPGKMRARNKAWRSANPEKVKEILLKASKDRVENPEKYRELDRVRYAKTADKQLRQKRDQYAADPEKFRALKRDWRAENQEKALELDRARYKQKNEFMRTSLISKIDDVSGKLTLARRRALLQSSKSTAKQRRLEHTITLEDIVIPDYCPEWHVPLLVSAPHRHPQLASIDRIDSRLGYIPGNVRVTCLAVNYVKLNHPQELFEDFTRLLRVSLLAPSSNEGQGGQADYMWRDDEVRLNPLALKHSRPQYFALAASHGLT